MNLIIQQTIVIHQLRVGSISNASMLQIGTAGSTKSLSQHFNTGGFVGPVPEPGKPFVNENGTSGNDTSAPFIPLVPFNR